MSLGSHLHQLAGGSQKILDRGTLLNHLYGVGLHVAQLGNIVCQDQA